ncbi:hypothetical protein CDD80_4787 [Ophiocordyceps camponoti-rufipedis]|uniref:HMG box domain-containing protein n=1 Tax=Ophiocordyceps camponoti-rufipedis TaxID=2004952 RepID=A0A2C5ZHU9_9HYPO|nr:hypothetical protein CDD80_4787 [Ophiocordyceps camponoti-rufipedis]
MRSGVYQPLPGVVAGELFEPDLFGYPNLLFGGGMAYRACQEEPRSSMNFRAPTSSPQLPIISREQGQVSSFTHALFTPETSPLLSTDGEDFTTTRQLPTESGRSCVGNSCRREVGRIEKRRKAPRSGTKPGMLDKYIQLDKPLSECIKDEGDTEVFDVFAHVHRETRKNEVGNDGKVKRPLNAFLLYRKHVIIFVKKKFLQEENKNNQQLVSRICGDSWKMETDEVKAKFKKLAQEEKSRHGEAFPLYKYTPKTIKKTENDGDGIKSETGARSASAGGRTLDSASPDAVKDPFEASYGSQPRAGLHEPRILQESHVESSYTFATQPPVGIGGQGQLQYTGYHDEAGATPDYTYGWSHNGLPQAGSYGLEASVDMQPRAVPVSNHELYIDPTLLPRVEEPVYHWHTNDDVLHENQGSWNPQSYMSNMVAAMPDLDINGAHEAYLKGGQEDWETSQLGESDSFNDWMMQQENAN